MTKKDVSLEVFSYYIGYFHDGSIRAITCFDDEIIFEMESTPIYICDNRDSLPLSERNTIYGRLHAKGIVLLKNNDKYVNLLRMEYDRMGIIDFEVEINRISLVGTWVKYGGSVPYEKEMFVCEVIAKEIYWENTANIKDPELLGKYMGLEGPPPYPYPQWYIDKYGPQDDDEGIGSQA